MDFCQGCLEMIKGDSHFFSGFWCMKCWNRNHPEISTETEKEVREPLKVRI